MQQDRVRQMVRKLSERGVTASANEGELGLAVSATTDGGRRVREVRTHTGAAAHATYLPYLPYHLR